MQESGLAGFDFDENYSVLAEALGEAAIAITGGFLRSSYFCATRTLISLAVRDYRRSVMRHSVLATSPQSSLIGPK